jgi:hypothetical protein
MILHALTESNSNQTLLLKLLQREHDAGWIKFWYSALPSSLYGSARTVLGVWKKPAALVLDADSTNPRAADRCRLDAEEVIGEAAGMAPLRVLVAVPALEALLFRRPDAVARAYGQIPPGLLELGQISPRDALAKLDQNVSLHQVALNLIKELNDSDIDALRDESPIRDLLEFLGELQRDAVLTTARS